MSSTRLRETGRATSSRFHLADHAFFQSASRLPHNQACRHAQRCTSSENTWRSFSTEIAMRGASGTMQSRRGNATRRQTKRERERSENESEGNRENIERTEPKVTSRYEGDRKPYVQEWRRGVDERLKCKRGEREL